MGEKGNVTSEELAARAASGAGAVVAAPGTQVTAVFEEAATTVRDKLVDKGADAAIATGQERWRRSREDEQPPEDDDTPRA